MSGYIFERDYFVHIYETNLNKELTIPSMMRYFEEMALLQSEAAGVGFDYYEKNSVGWVLHQFGINIKQLPLFGQKVILRTQPISTFKFMGFRKYWILDHKGEELVSADTVWLFINPKSRRPIRVNDDMKKAYGHNNLPEQKKEMPEIPLLQRTDHKHEFYVRYSDIDVNLHVNNTHYIEWALEAIPREIRKDAILKNIQISFKRETSYPAHILSEAQVEKNTKGYESLHRISSIDGTLRCMILMQWEQ